MSVSSLHLLLLTLIVAISLSPPCTGAENDALLVRVSHGGQVRGIKEKSLNGKEFYSYMGIPYAEPPVGMLRFKDPLPVKPWEGILDALKMPVPCLQVQSEDTLLEPRVSMHLFGAEDCLYLCVYTNSPNEPKKKLPVMVFIHGGGFVFGSSHQYPPHVLMDTDVILVVIQYRLGIFGFMSTEDAVMPGNMGLKDQQLALKWIKENIAAFGGDPDSITIFGQSAGGASVHYQILSPGSKGLFKRAIIQSGPALCPWAFNINHRKFAIETGSRFNCSVGHGTKNFRKCMQNVDAFYLIIAAFSTTIVGQSPLYVLPRVDGEFISKAPEILMKEGKYNKVDVMAGIVRDEGAIILLMFYLNPKVYERINKDFAKYGPLSLLIEDEKNAAYLARKIYQFYLEREDTTIQEEVDRYKILKMFTDRYFVDPHDVTSHLFTKTRLDLYLYQLDHFGTTSLLDLIPGFNRTNIIAHSDDMAYFFEGTNKVTDKVDLELRKIILSLWTNFAKSGNPNSPDLGFVWEKATENNFRHLSLIPNPVMKDDMFQEERKFWLSLKTRRNLNLRGEVKYPI